MINILFAQTPPDDSVLQATESLLGLAVTAAQSNRAYWDGMWNSLFDSGLWAGLEWCAGGIALFSVVFWGAFFMRGLLAEDVTPALSDMVWPLVILFFLVHPAGTRSNLTRMLDAARTVPYTMVDQISLRTSGDLLDLQNTIRLAGYRIAMEQLVRAIYNQCAALPVASFQTCLSAHSQETSDVIQMLSSISEEVFAAEAEEIEQVFRGERDPYTGTQLSSQVFARDSVKDALIAFLLSWQKDTQPMVEYALLASATMAPLCLAASLLPFGNRPILGWLAGFIGTCTAFVGYYILMSLSAHNYLYNLGGFDTPAYMIKAALIDPLLGVFLGIGSTRGFLHGTGYLPISPVGLGMGLLGRSR